MHFVSQASHPCLHCWYFKVDVHKKFQVIFKINCFHYRLPNRRTGEHFWAPGNCSHDILLYPVHGSRKNSMSYLKQNTDNPC